MPKTIAIVGAGPGIALATAERFGAEGFNVALISRSRANLDGLAGRLKAKGIEAVGFPGDVLDRASLVKALDAAIAHFGAIDVLLYQPNPPPGTMRAPRAIDVDNEQLFLDVVLLGGVAAVQAVLPGMLERKSGALLFTSAISAQYPVPFTASFGVAAGAVLNYTRVLNQDLKADGIYAGIVSVAGMVVQRGEENGESPTGLPLVVAQDVADAHWRLYTERNAMEAIVGPGEMFKAMTGI